MKKIEDQLIELETKIAFNEQSIDELNTVIIDQQNQILLLEKKLISLSTKLNDSMQHWNENNPNEEIPPHY